MRAEPAPDLDFLSSTPIFGGVQAPALSSLAALLERRTFTTASRIVAEGDGARELFVVEQGILEVTRHGKVAGLAPHEEELVLAVLHRGDCFGEMSLLDIQPRSATVRARTDVSLLVLPYRELLGLEQRDHHTFALFVLNIAREVSRRLREAQRLLVTFELAALEGKPMTQEVFGSALPERAGLEKR